MYAYALNNLGSLELYRGEFHAAETALRKAKGLYAKSGDHAGLAESHRTSRSLRSIETIPMLPAAS